MVTFQLFSDLHLEFYSEKFKKGTFSFDQRYHPVAENLILAGDIGYPEHRIFQEFLKYCATQWKRVFYVAGNHEYYQGWKGKPSNRYLESMFLLSSEINPNLFGAEPKLLPYYELDKIMDRVCTSYGVHFLNNRSMEIPHETHPSCQIVGTTLWSRIPHPDWTVSETAMNDYRNIYITSTPNHLTLRPKDTVGLFERNLRFLEDQTRNTNTKYLIVTHHLPSFELIADCYKKSSKFNFCYASDLEHLMDPNKILTWCCGHSHAQMKKIIRGVPCYINCGGYPTENVPFENDFTFTI